MCHDPCRDLETLNEEMYLSYRSDEEEDDVVPYGFPRRHRLTSQSDMSTHLCEIEDSDREGQTSAVWFILYAKWLNHAICMPGGWTMLWHSVGCRYAISSEIILFSNVVLTKNHHHYLSTDCVITLYIFPTHHLTFDLTALINLIINLQVISVLTSCQCI